jgi:molybdopterin-synthase adenylyltransferase
MDRYLSQRLYKNIGKKGQDRLKKAHVLIIGVGALGTICAELLVRAGIGKLTLIDRDIIELSNLQRQVLFDEEDIGKPKAHVAKEKLSKINSETEINEKGEDIDYKNLKMIGHPDMLIAATDNMESRFLLNDYCLKNKIPLVYGGAVADRGSVFSVISSGPCLRCVFPGSTEETCDNSGILNTNSSIIGSMMAGEAIKILTRGINTKELIHLNVWENILSKIKVNKNPKCPACKGNYQYLKGEIKTKFVSLCGQETYQIKGKRKNLLELSKKLSNLGETKRLGNVLQFSKITIFENGRAIIKAKSEKEAKLIYSRYIGN